MVKILINGDIEAVFNLNTFPFWKGLNDSRTNVFILLLNAFTHWVFLMNRKYLPDKEQTIINELPKILNNFSIVERSKVEKLPANTVF